MKSLAHLISRIFDPMVEIPILLGLAVWFAYLNGFAWKFLLVLMLIDAVIPFLFFLHLYRTREVHDWDISRRWERIPVYGFTLLAHLGGIGLAILTGRTEVAQILSVFWLLGILFFGLTFFWKVSVHTGMNAAMATFLVLMVGVQFSWVYGLLIPVGWARISLGHHTFTQFSVGALLASFSMWLGFRLFGLV